jgi:hypothetical protein
MFDATKQRRQLGKNRNDDKYETPIGKLQLTERSSVVNSLPTLPGNNHYASRGIRVMKIMKFSMSICISLAIISSLMAKPPATSTDKEHSLRVWTDSTGNHRVEAEFVELRGDVVCLKRKDGTLIRVPKERLSAADQAYAERASQTDSQLPRKGTEGGQRRAADADDLTIWPNRVSYANSDPWLAQNHDRLRVMRPRVLVINFSNEHTLRHIQQLTANIILGLAEGSRWHGYSNRQAPAFLQYQVFKIVDLRDADRTTGDSRRMPAKPPEAGAACLRFRYAALYDEDFAKFYGIADPEHDGRYLTLAQMVERGFLHEVWVVNSGRDQPERRIGMWESIELKAPYSPDFTKTAGKPVHCGNGADPDQPWIGRSLRIGCINASRGPGCFLESLSHSFEGMCLSNVIPYVRPYFAGFAGFDLDKRYKTPFSAFYGADRRNRQIEYPNPHTALVPHGDTVVRIDNYVAAGGNVHFTPNGRGDYDMTNLTPVMSTIEDWRMGSGPGGCDKAKPWTASILKPYQRDYFGDCMGPWLVYWRQNIPGLDNKAKDDQGKPMKNWWPFLFY